MANEKRLIAFDPIVFESFTRHATKHREPYDHYDMGYVDAVDQIEYWLDANTVEAVEVVHGRWEFLDPVSPTVFCSVCKNLAPLDDFADYHSARTNYCPNCGADMRGDDYDYDK